MTSRIETLGPEPIDSEDRAARLESLATEIERYRRDADAHAGDNLMKQRVVGRALHQAKALVKQSKYPGGWRAWCPDRGWGVRWADSLIRLHVRWLDVQEAVVWQAEGGVSPDGVTAALRAINEWKRRDETDEDKERRKRTKGARHDRKARDLVVARLLHEIRTTGEIPDTWPVEAGEFIVDILHREQGDPAGVESEKRTSRLDDQDVLAVGLRTGPESAEHEEGGNTLPEACDGTLAGTHTPPSVAGEVRPEASEQEAASRRVGRRRSAPVNARRRGPPAPSVDDTPAQRFVSADVVLLPAPSASAGKSYPIAWRLDPSSQRRIRH